MESSRSGSVRARVRAELTDEIKSTARRHLATDGANLSLRAVARDLGMVSSAIYRYFASRDDLLTALIIDAYDSLGEAAEQAYASVPSSDLDAGWMAICRAIRSWALANRPEYALTYGSPVPGYAAPQDTIGPASRPVLLLAELLREGVRRGQLDARSTIRMPAPLRADLRRVAALPGFDGVPEVIFVRGMTAWTQLFGVISFELFGRLTNAIEDYDAYFDYQMRVMSAHLGFR
ncbi:MAG TPA: TetR/AcrR family transcriptional regulator [Jatrophihabitantaceae bacterium]|nr:TetR/AcrR family transcriptional regulator [Jatrophihabitantaceae bacterium]